MRNNTTRGSRPRPAASDHLGVPERLLGALRESEDQVVEGDPETGVRVVPTRRSYNIAEEIGLDDGKHPNQDENSVDTHLPHQKPVHDVAQAPRTALGRLAQAISTSYHDGTLGQVLPGAVTRHPSRFLLACILAVVGLVMVFETLVGQRLWQRLVPGLSDHQSVAASLVLTVLLAVGSIIAAWILHTRCPGLIAAFGGRLVVVWAALVLTCVGLLAYVLGGGVQAQPTAGGTSGGGRASTPPSLVGEHVHVALMLAYFLLLTVANVTIFGLHLLQQHRDDVVYVNATINERDRAAEASVPSDRLNAFYAHLLRECLGAALESVNSHGRGVVGAYNSGVERHISPELKVVWKRLDFDDSEPDWVSEIRSEIQAAERGVRIAAVR